MKHLLAGITKDFISRGLRFDSIDDNPYYHKAARFPGRRMINSSCGRGKIRGVNGLLYGYLDGL